jgi:hypothetical protein
MGTITPEERNAIISASPVAGQSEEAVDRESAYEKLAKRASERAEAEKQVAEEKEQARDARAAPRQRDSATDRFVKNIAGSVGRQLGSTIVRSVVRGILGGFSRR